MPVEQNRPGCTASLFSGKHMAMLLLAPPALVIYAANAGTLRDV